MAVKDIIFEAQVRFNENKSNLDRLQKELDQVTTKMNQAKKGSIEYIAAERRLIAINAELGNSFEAPKKGVSGLLSNYGSLVKLAGAGIALNGLKNFAVAGFESATALEANTIAFETMLGSAEQAKDLLEEIQGFTSTTPFQEEEVTKAGKSLLAFNVEAKEVVPTLRRIGDISAGIGAPIGEIAELYGKAKVQGRLFAEDINQLTGRGIPIIQELSKQFGVADSQVKKLVEDGKVGFPNLEQAFRDLTAEGSKFGGLTERLSTSTSGLISTMKDNLAIFARTFIQGFLPAINKGVVLLTRLFSNLSSIAKPLRDLISGNEDLQKSTLDVFNENEKYLKSGRSLIEQYKELSQKTNLTAKEKSELSNVTNDLIKQFGDSVAEIDKETGALKINTDEVLRQIQVRAALQSETIRTLIAEKLKAETQISLAKNAREELDRLSESNGLAGTTFTAFIDELKKGNLNAFAETYGRLGKSIEDYDEKTQIVIKRAQELTSVLGLEKLNIAKLEEVNKALKDAGINIDEIALKASGGPTGNNIVSSLIPPNSIEGLKANISFIQKEIEKLKFDNEEGLQLSFIDQKKLDADLKKLKELQVQLIIAEKLASSKTGIDKDTLAAQALELEKQKIQLQLDENRKGDLLLLEQKEKFIRANLAQLEKQGEQETDLYRKLNDEIEVILLQKELLNKKYVDKQAQVHQELEEEFLRHAQAIEAIEFKGDNPELLKLRQTIDAEEQRLSFLKQSIGAQRALELDAKRGTIDLLNEQLTEEELAYIKQSNKIIELKKKEQDELKKLNQSQLQDVLQTVNQTVGEVKQSVDSIVNLKQQEADRQISAQQRRVEEAQKIAEKGNADVLEAEEKRLEKIQKKREQYARVEQALNAALVVSNSLVAIAKAAAEGGPAAPFTIAAAVIALATGLIAAKQAATNSVSFRKGGEANWSKLSGFTGWGNPDKKSNTLGNKPYDYEHVEYIMPEHSVKRGRNLFWFEKIRNEGLDLESLFKRNIDIHDRWNTVVIGGGNNSGYLELKQEMRSLHDTIKNRPTETINITKRGITKVVEDHTGHRRRIRKRS